MKRLPLFLLLFAAGCAKSTASTPPGAPAPQPTDTVPVEATPAAVDLQPVAKLDLGGTLSYTYSLDLQITPDGKRASIAMTPTGGKPSMQVWELGATPKKLFQGEQTYGSVTPALSPSGKRVVAHKCVYDVESGKKLATLPEFTYSHAFFQGEDRVVATQRSHGFDKPVKGKVTVWDVTANKDAGSFEVPDDRFQDAFSVKGGKELGLFLANDKCEIECWEVATKKLIRTVTPAGAPAKSSGSNSGVTSDGSVFTVSFRDPLVYSGTSGAVVGGLPPSTGGMTDGLTPGGTRMFGIYYELTSPKEKTVVPVPALYDWKSRQRLATFRGFASDAKGFHAAASADGKTAVAVSEQGQALVFDLTTLK